MLGCECMPQYASLSAWQIDLATASHESLVLEVL